MTWLNASAPSNQRLGFEHVFCSFGQWEHKTCFRGAARTAVLVGTLFQFTVQDRRFAGFGRAKAGGLFGSFAFGASFAGEAARLQLGRGSVGEARN